VAESRTVIGCDGGLGVPQVGTEELDLGHVASLGEQARSRYSSSSIMSNSSGISRREAL